MEYEFVIVMKNYVEKFDKETKAWAQFRKMQGGWMRGDDGMDKIVMTQAYATSKDRPFAKWTVSLWIDQPELKHE